MVSVIIPYYKNAQEIERSLMSVILQTYQDFEVIIVNDASPDWEEGLKIINSFGNSRIKTISHSINRNGATARNTGIKAAKGEYIAFLDADDEWLQGHLEDALHEFKEKGADIVYSQATVISENGTSVMPENGILKGQSISDYLFVQGAVIFTPSILIERKLALQNLFNPKLQRHQDYDFLLRCELSSPKIALVQKPNVIVHWEHNNPKAKGGTWDFSLQFAKAYKQYFTPVAYSRFIFKFVVLPLLEDRQVTQAAKLFFKYIKPFHLSLLNFYFVFSYSLFGEFKHPYKWKR